MITMISTTQIPRTRRKVTHVAQDIKDFMESGGAACEVELPEGSKLMSIYNAYLQTAKRMEAPVQVMKRGDRLFMVRKEEAEEGGCDDNADEE